MISLGVSIQVIDKKLNTEKNKLKQTGYFGDAVGLLSLWGCYLKARGYYLLPYIKISLKI